MSLDIPDSIDLEPLEDDEQLERLIACVKVLDRIVGRTMSSFAPHSMQYEALYRAGANLQSTAVLLRQFRRLEAS